MESLLSARNLIAQTLQKSDSVSSAIEASSRNLEKASSNLADSSDSLRSLRQRISTLSALSLHADQAAGPASAHSSVVLLKRSLSASDPATDLPGYLASVRRLEQALSFLTENSALAIHWLNEIASLLDESSPADKGYASNVKRSLAVLEELKAMEARDRLPGGALCLALDKLELQLRRLILLLNIPPLDDPPQPVDNSRALTAVIDRLRLNGRGGRVGPIYVDARVSAARSGLALVWGPDNDGDDVDIGEWVKQVEFAVRQVIQLEHDLCRKVCEGSGGVISMECYAEIVAGSGFLDLLGGFGSKVVAAKKDAAKLLKLLDVFGALDGLRPDFNRLFGGKECVRVQGVTRDLVRRVVEGAFDIFQQLALEVERLDTAVGGGGGVTGVPRLVVFVTDYCQVLLDDRYKGVLLQVLSIHRIWHRGQHDDAPPDPEQLLVEVVCRIMGALEGRLEKWSNGLDDPALACSFLINNYRYLHRHLKDTELGRLLGEEYLAKMELYAAAYQERSSCGKIPTSIVKDDGLTLGRRRMRAYT